MLAKLLQWAFKQRVAAKSALTERPSIADSSPPAPDLVATAYAYAQNSNLTLAQQVLEQAIALDPHQSATHDALGNVLRMQDSLEEALSSYRRAIQLDPSRVSAFSNIGLCLRDLGRIDEARLFLEQAVDLDRANPMIRTNLAALLYDTGCFEEASTLIETVLKSHPDFAEAHIVRGTRLLRRGDFARGWIDYEWRHHNAERTHAAEYQYPVWNGQPISRGSLLVCSEQGLGDQIMFASCLGDALRVAPDLLVECDARLKALFARSYPQVRFYVARKTHEETWLRDGYVPIAKTWMGSLPRWFRQHATDFSKQAGYLQVDPARVERWSHAVQALGRGPKIGISWRGGVPGTRRRLRSIPLMEWAPLLQWPTAHFVSLQYGNCESEIEQLRKSTGTVVAHWQDAIRDLDETAALVSALDLVISVQTTVVHLAGALQKRILVLVPRIAEWRYGENGSRMPWYESATLIRQQRTGDWTDVIDRAGTVVRSMT